MNVYFPFYFNLNEKKDYVFQLSNTCSLYNIKRCWDTQEDSEMIAKYLRDIKSIQ